MISAATGTARWLAVTFYTLQSEFNLNTQFKAFATWLLIEQLLKYFWKKFLVLHYYELALVIY